MACNSCSTDDGGQPKGCKNNGTCGTDSCNKLTVFDWLANMSLPSGEKPFDWVEVRFKNGRKNNDWDLSTFCFRYKVIPEFIFYNKKYSRFYLVKEFSGIPFSIPRKIMNRMGRWIIFSNMISRRREKCNQNFVTWE